jgi:hypothetical protein
MGWLGIAASAGLFHPDGVIGEHGKSLALRAIGSRVGGVSYFD